MDQTTVLLVILGMAAATYVPRLAPAWLLSRRELNPLLARWLSYVPAAVLGALTAQSVLAPTGSVDVSATNLYLWAAVPCLILALRTRGFFGVVALGMGLVAGARFFLG
jgi:branched-subunit amino acid transport protein